MDPELRQAACLGDIEFLKRAIATKSIDYFLSYYSSPDPDGFYHSEMMGNILHLSARKDKLNFMREAMKLLPNHVVLRLLSQQDECDQNPLHVAAAQKACFEPVGLILGFYKSLSEDDNHHHNVIEKPWLALNQHNRTPLHVILSGLKITEDSEECALEILSMDSLESFCNTVDSQGNSPLFYAVKNRFSRVSEEILKSSSSYSVSGENGITPLHFAPNSSENVLRLLLEKHPDMVDKVEDIKAKGFNVPHQWAVLNEIWPFNFLKKGGFPDASSKIFIDLIKSTENIFGDSPLHTAARTANVEIGRALVQGYQREIEARNQTATEILFRNSPPWNLKNKFGETPFIVAIASKNVELALYFLSIDKTLCQIHTRSGRSPLLYAVCFCDSLYGQVVEEILSIQEPDFGDLRAMDGTTVLHPVGNCPEEIGTMVLEKYWWMMNLIDDKGKTALDYAKEAQVSWLVRLLRNQSLIQKEPFDWVTACQQNETWAVVAFVDTCQDLHKVCREKQDTPLHHITFQTYQECLQFLKKDSIADLKNTTDSEGATPLHRALERKDMYLAKALLADDGVKRNIADHNGITAMNLLTKLCQEDDHWDTINPDLKTSYIQSRTNLDQMRTTLSVVAALLATITFAAGFTLPGGLNSETGSAMLGKKASFIVFLLADAYAMCTSILVLFCLIWSMVCDEDMSYVLVDRSVFILMQSLYGSLVAFMTGIYTVMNQSKLWVAIVIFIMCSLLGIAANRTVLYTILSKLIPASNRDYKKLPSLQKQRTMPKFGIDKYLRRHQNVQDQTDDNHDPPLLLEEGKKSTFGIDMIAHSSEGTSNSHQNQDEKDDGYRLALLEEGKS